MKNQGLTGAYMKHLILIKIIHFGDIMCIFVHMFSSDLHPECLCGTVKGRVDVFKVSRALVDKQEGVVQHWGC